jgi:hypothetical protein
MKKIKSILCSIFGHKWTLKRKNASHLVCERCGELKPLFLGPKTKSKVKATSPKEKKKAAKKVAKTTGRGKKSGPGAATKATKQTKRAPRASTGTTHRGRPKGSKNVKKNQLHIDSPVIRALPTAIKADQVQPFPPEPIIPATTKITLFNGTSGTPKPVENFGKMKEEQVKVKAEKVEGKQTTRRGRKPGSKNKAKATPETKVTEPVVNSAPIPTASEEKPARRSIMAPNPASKGASVPPATAPVVEGEVVGTDKSPFEE